jgi:hypothetical protein
MLCCMHRQISTLYNNSHYIGSRSLELIDNMMKYQKQNLYLENIKEKNTLKNNINDKSFRTSYHLFPIQFFDTLDKIFLRFLRFRWLENDITFMTCFFCSREFSNFLFEVRLRFVVLWILHGRVYHILEISVQVKFETSICLHSYIVTLVQ